MEEIGRKWTDYTDEEKLLVIDGYLDGVVALDDENEKVNKQRLEWLRGHIPAYKVEGGKNYIFVSYSHLDYKEVYKDLAAFSYNSQRRVRFWYDEGLPIGQDWEKAAGELIKNPRCVGVLFYLSKNLLLSPSVFKEIEYVKNSGKRYFAIALNPDFCSAEAVIKDIDDEELDDIRSRLNELTEFFPNNNTAIPYGADTVSFRIDRIAREFNVTEEVFSDFVCEEVEGGLKLVAYRGNKTEVHIPERIGDKNIVGIAAEFPNAVAVYIPKTVISIDCKAFDNAENLQEIIVDNNPKYFDLNGVLCERETKTRKNGSCVCTLLRAPICWEWKRQFADYNYRESVIKDGLSSDTNILYNGEFSTYGISDLLTNFNSELLDKYGELFEYMRSALENGGQKEIREMKSAIYERKLNKLYKLLKKIKQFSVFGSISYIGEGAFKSCKKLNYLFLPDNIRKIECLAFKNSSLILIFLPAPLKVLEWGLFDDCTNLQSVLTKTDYYYNERSRWEKSFNKVLLFGNIQMVIDSFDNNAFAGFEYNENIVFQHWGFNKCAWLEEIKISGKTQELLGAFSNCVRLRKVEIEEGVERLLENCFNDCLCLVEIKIPKTVKFIEDNCFWGCENLHTLEYGGTMADWRILEKTVYDGRHYALECDNWNEYKVVCTNGVIGRRKRFKF